MIILISNEWEIHFEIIICPRWETTDFTMPMIVMETAYNVDMNFMQTKMLINLDIITLNKVLLCQQSKSQVLLEWDNYCTLLPINVHLNEEEHNNEIKILELE